MGKVLESGLLLVTGPYKLNGVRLRRVNAAYVIGTQTKVDISGVKIPAEAQKDDYYKRQKAPAAKAAGKGKEAAKREPDAARVELQRNIDTQLLAEIKKTPLLGAYLRRPFTLDKNSRPHMMK